MANLTDDEEKLIANFRNLSEEDQDYVYRLLGVKKKPRGRNKRKAHLLAAAIGVGIPLSFLPGGAFALGGLLAALYKQGAFSKDLEEDWDNDEDSVYDDL